MIKLISVFLVCIMLFGMVSCSSSKGNTVTTAASTQASNPQDETTQGATNETTDTEENGETTTADVEQPVVSPYGIDMSDLNDLMQPIFAGTSVKNETVMFIDYGDVRTLLFPIDSIISVTSYDGSIVYEEGKDYELVDGKIKVLANSSIPCITTENYYNAGSGTLKTKYNGKVVNTYWGEDMMDEWQVNINYTHSSIWNGFKQESKSDIYADFIDKLMNGEDVTVIFSGDSITYGANASWVNGYAPYQHSYPMLFVEALADLFDYTVQYVRVNHMLAKTAPVPTEDYVAGSKGTITYINTAVGGWTSAQGKNNAATYVVDYASVYGCDLLVLAYGMNDGGDPMETRNNVKAIADSVLQVKPETDVVLLSTMVCNPADYNRSAASKANQRGELNNLAAYYLENGVACGVCDMGSVSLSVLTRKTFHDYSGNNINHPNDFFVRVYAQTLLQTVIGYENMNQ